MPILSAKRQVTLPKELCDRLLLQPGDLLEFFEHRGRITIIKKVPGASLGVARHLKANKKYSDEDSLRSTIAARRRAALV